MRALNLALVLGLEEVDDDRLVPLRVGVPVFEGDYEVVTIVAAGHFDVGFVVDVVDVLVDGVEEVQ